MKKKIRDDFPEKTKTTLAIRAAFFCSHPNCVKLTVGPHSDPNKGLRSGHAAHIHAASPQGPRYKPQQTSAQRTSATNGIWLCRECGDLVDKDSSGHSASMLRKWKHNHEKLISEVRTKGYAHSLALLQSRRVAPQTAKKVVTLLEDRRALWERFDAEFPDRVRISLDGLRSKLTELRGDLPEGNELDQIILSLTKTIHIFFVRMEKVDLCKLQCNSRDPDWCQFRDALAALRKSMGLQVSKLAEAYGTSLSPDLKLLIPS